MNKKYTKKTNSAWSYIAVIFKAVLAFFKLIFFVLSIPYKIYKGIEDIINAVKVLSQKA